MTEFSFILGNGKTRKDFSLHELKSNGKLYGCNRIYEEIVPDVLVSTDKNMAEEIQKSEYSKNNNHYTREKHIIIGSGAKALDPMYQAFSSGPNALAISAKETNNSCFMIGFDLISDSYTINNLYAGTSNYLEKTAKATEFVNWVDQVYKIVETYDKQKFFHVNPLNNYTPDSWLELPNLEIMSKDNFKTLINM